MRRHPHLKQLSRHEASWEISACHTNWEMVSGPVPLTPRRRRVGSDEEVGHLLMTPRSIESLDKRSVWLTLMSTAFAILRCRRFEQPMPDFADMHFPMRSSPSPTSLYPSSYPELIDGLGDEGFHVLTAGALGLAHDALHKLPQCLVCIQFSSYAS
jgi:hypothetical protein